MVVFFIYFPLKNIFDIFKIFKEGGGEAPSLGLIYFVV